jgi:hypothetical protein
VKAAHTPGQLGADHGATLIDLDGVLTATQSINDGAF